MSAPLEMTPDAAPEAVLEGAGGAAIEGRSLGRIAWLRLIMRTSTLPEAIHCSSVMPTNVPIAKPQAYPIIVTACRSPM